LRFLPIYILIFMLFSCVDKSPDEPIEPDPKPEIEPKPEPESQPWKIGFIAIGDQGTGNKDQFAVADGIEKYCLVNQCDFGITLGDNIYDNGIKSDSDPLMQERFEKPYKNLKFIFYPTLGNHDVRHCWICQVRYQSPKWKMGGQWYEYSKGQAQFFALDTNWDYYRTIFGGGKKQREWLEGKLAQSSSRWKIIYGHHPVYSNGMHGDGLRMKSILRPELLKYKVDFYFSGHDHHLELIEKDGMRYIISGAAGKLRSVKPDKYTKYAKSTLGFAHMTLTQHEAKLRFIDYKARIIYEKVFKKD